jgi:hypothetical protein
MKKLCEKYGICRYFLLRLGKFAACINEYPAITCRSHSMHAIQREDLHQRITKQIIAAIEAGAYSHRSCRPFA